MAEKLNQWLDRFVEKGANPGDVEGWPDEMEGNTVQPDWNQQDDTQPDYIKNKPDIDGQIESKLNSEVLNLIKTDVQGNVFINTGFSSEYVLATEFDENATYYEAYHSIDDTKLTGSWYAKINTTPTNYPISFTEGTAFTQGFGAGLNYVDSFQTGSSSSQINFMSVHYYQDGTRKTNGGPMWWIDRWNIEELSFNMENATLLEWVKTYFTKRSDTYYTDDYPTLDEVIAYDQTHPKYREIELTQETFVPNTYYVIEKTPNWINIQDLLN